jgi:uncharacterized membrane protein YhaH (DUF805 family)
MQTANPYDAPKAEVVGNRNEEFGAIKVFSSSGRIGRIRYIGYTIGLTWLILAAAGFLGGLLSTLVAPMVGVAVIAIAYIAVLVAVVLLTVQRAHDFDKSGWLALVLIVPLINLIFWFIAGTDGENRYGRRPPPNNALAVIIALIVPILIVGVLAAIALPAYQDYVKRAQVQQSQ